MALRLEREFAERNSFDTDSREFYIISNISNHWITTRCRISEANEEGERVIDLLMVDPAGEEANILDNAEDVKEMPHGAFELPLGYKLGACQYCTTTQQRSDSRGTGLSTCGIRAIFNALFISRNIVNTDELWRIDISEKRLRESAEAIVNNDNITENIAAINKLSTEKAESESYVERLKDQRKNDKHWQQKISSSEGEDIIKFPS